MGRSRKKGNMMLLVGMVAAIIIILLVVFFSIQFVFFSQKRIQSHADELALSLGRILNDADNVGFMNHITAYSRESVFNSRKTYGQINERAQQLEPLARELLNDAREGVRLVEREKQSLMSYEFREMNRIIQEQERNPPPPVNLPWSSYSSPTISIVEIGNIKNVQSNATAPTGNDELLTYDRRNQYLQPKTDLYFAERAVKLEPPDSDLMFRFSSVPAPVKNTIAPPRLATPDVFDKEGAIFDSGKQSTPSPETIPSAVSVEVISTVKMAGKDGQDVVKGRAVAAACGAGPPP